MIEEFYFDLDGNPLEDGDLVVLYRYNASMGKMAIFRKHPSGTGYGYQSTESLKWVDVNAMIEPIKGSLFQKVKVVQ